MCVCVACVLRVCCVRVRVAVAAGALSEYFYGGVRVACVLRVCCVCVACMLEFVR